MESTAKYNFIKNHYASVSPKYYDGAWVRKSLVSFGDKVMGVWALAWGPDPACKKTTGWNLI